jgi:hypothetical protein
MGRAWLACTGLREFSRHAEEAARAPGLRQHHKLQQQRAPALVGVGRHDPRAVELGGRDAVQELPHRP